MLLVCFVYLFLTPGYIVVVGGRQLDLCKYKLDMEILNNEIQTREQSSYTTPKSSPTAEKTTQEHYTQTCPFLVGIRNSKLKKLG